MVSTRRFLRTACVLILHALVLAGAPRAEAGADDFKFGQKLAQAESKAFDAMKTADVPFQKALAGMLSLADSYDAFAQKNTMHPKARDARLRHGEVHLAIVKWCLELLVLPDTLVARKTTPGEVSAAARTAVEAASSRFEAFKGSGGDLGEQSDFFWTVAQYYKALTLDAGSAAQVAALRFAEATHKDYISKNDGKVRARGVQEVLGLTLAKRAKHTPNDEERAQLYGQALDQFKSFAKIQYTDDDTLEQILVGFLRYGETCLEAGKIGQRDFISEGLEMLSGFSATVPLAMQRDLGIEVLFSLAELTRAKGNLQEAVDRYEECTAYAANRQMTKLVNRAWGQVKPLLRVEKMCHFWDGFEKGSYAVYETAGQSQKRLELRASLEPGVFLYWDIQKYGVIIPRYYKPNGAEYLGRGVWQLDVGGEPTEFASIYGAGRWHGEWIVRELVVSPGRYWNRVGNSTHSVTTPAGRFECELYSTERDGWVPSRVWISPVVPGGVVQVMYTNKDGSIGQIVQLVEYKGRKP